MNETPPQPDPALPGQPVVQHRRWPVSLVWLVPAVAVAVGLWMLIHAWSSAGPTVQVTFRTAAGLEAGKTPLKYKDVTLGVVSAIALSDDRTHVVVTLKLDRGASSLAREDTRFWVVRPRIGSGGISGIDTLLSGAYIAADAGKSPNAGDAFTGLESPPTVINDAPGRSFVLRADDLGSLDIGSPLYYRRIRVGQVASYKLDADGRSVSIQVFVDAPYDRYVAPDTVFWNASGVDLTLGADGLKLNTQSVATILAGGIGFGRFARTPPTPAAENTVYELAKDRQTALAPPDGPGQYLQLRFAQSLRGLALGAPVVFSGVDFGRVVGIELDYDAKLRRFPTVVGIFVYPQRLGRVQEKLPLLKGDSQEQAAHFLAGLVERGLRAQARSGNLLTGQLFIALEFVPGATRVAFDVNARPLLLPTVPGGLDQLQEQVAGILRKVEKIPFDSIGNRADTALAELNKSLNQINGQLLPETTQTVQQARQTIGAAQALLAEDAPLQQGLEQTLQETQRAARALRVLADLLTRHPEALLRGRPGDPPPLAPLGPAAAPLPAPGPVQTPAPASPATPKAPT
jgi:paraquat-inducible protein B